MLSKLDLVELARWFLVNKVAELVQKFKPVGNTSSTQKRWFNNHEIA